MGKHIESLENKASEIDRASDQLVEERNLLKQKTLGIDKSLREIYSGVIAREEEKRKGEAAEQKLQKDVAAKSRAEQRESVQRQQWGNSAARERVLNKLETSALEDEQRKKFTQDVENWAQDKEKLAPQIPVPPKKQ